MALSRRYFFYGGLLAGAVPAGGFTTTPALSTLSCKLGWGSRKMEFSKSKGANRCIKPTLRKGWGFT